MGETLFTLHWAVRYLVLLAGLAAVVVAALRLREGTIGESGRIAGAIFSGMLDLQLLLGVGVLLTRAFYPALMGHLTMMLLAVVVAHATMAVLKRRPPERRSPAIQLGGTVLALVLIVGGIMAIGRRVI